MDGYYHWIDWHQVAVALSMEIQPLSFVSLIFQGRLELMC